MFIRVQSRTRQRLDLDHQKKVAAKQEKVYFRERLPKLSKRQLVEVAMRLFRKALPDWPEYLEDDPVPEIVAENARRLHAASGYSNDLAFAVARVLNAAWSRAGDIDLKRPDAMARAGKPLREATRLASQLTALDYAFDSASFGHFVVSSHDSHAQIFQFDIADLRLHLITIFAIRRRMTAIISGHRIDRFVREALAASGAGVVNNALMRSFARANRGLPEPDDFARLELVLERLLLEIDANDDLLVAATQAEPIAQGEMPPFFVIGEGGAAELVNYRVNGRYLIVDRLFHKAELRLGAGRRQLRVRITNRARSE